METVEIREERGGFPQFPQARGKRSPRAIERKWSPTGPQIKSAWWILPESPVFRSLRNDRSRRAGKQDAVEDYSEPGAEIQVFRIWRSPVGRNQRRSRIGRGGLGAAEQPADMFGLQPAGAGLRHA